VKNSIVVALVALGIGYWWGKHSAPAPEVIRTIEVPKPRETAAAVTPETPSAPAAAPARAVVAAATANCPTYAAAENPNLPEVEGIEIIDIATKDLEKLKGDWVGATEHSEGPNLKINLKIGQGAARDLEYDVSGFIGNASGSDSSAIGSEKGTGHSIVRLNKDTYLKLYERDSDQLSGLVYSKPANATEFESAGWVSFYRR